MGDEFIYLMFNYVSIFSIFTFGIFLLYKDDHNLAWVLRLTSIIIFEVTNIILLYREAQKGKVRELRIILIFLCVIYIVYVIHILKNVKEKK